MKKNYAISVVSFFLLLLTLSGCKKSDIGSSIKSNKPIQAAIPAFPLDWENIDYMPTPNGEAPILVPWASGSNQLFASELAFDYKKLDGWELVYNTFSITQPSSIRFFTLYNKYNGVLRFYIYLPPGTPVPSTYLTDGLSIAGNSASSIVNFNNPIANVDTVITSVTRVNKYGLQSSGAWFISQFEIAYDSNLANISYQNLNFVWNLASTSVSNVNLNGESNGTLTGTVGAGSAGGFNPSGLLNNAAKGTLYAAGLSSLNGVKANNSNILQAVIGGLKGGLTGAVTGLISAIIGGTPTSPQMVDLKLQSTINLTGTFSSSSGITNTTLIIPGSLNSQSGPGYVPAYNKILGVFNFGASPNFAFNEALTSVPFLYGPLPSPQRMDRDTYTLTFTKSIPTVLNINPELTNNGAVVEIIRQDLLIPHAPYLKYPNPQNFVLNDGGAISNAPSGTYTAEENILGTEYFVADITNLNSIQIKFSAVSPYNSVAKNKLQYNNAAIRYTIKVTPPNNGSPYTIIRSVKTKLN